MNDFKMSNGWIVEVRKQFSGSTYISRKGFYETYQAACDVADSLREAYSADANIVIIQGVLLCSYGCYKFAFSIPEYEEYRKGVTV